MIENQRFHIRMLFWVTVIAALLVIPGLWLQNDAGNGVAGLYFMFLTVIYTPLAVYAFMESIH